MNGGIKAKQKKSVCFVSSWRDEEARGRTDRTGSSRQNRGEISIGIRSSKFKFETATEEQGGGVRL